jgi:hypothetical protein
VVAPDPISPFANSRLVQHQTIRLHPTSSLCFIDWISSGRWVNGEQRQQSRLETTTTISFKNKDNEVEPTLVESMVLLGNDDNNFNSSNNGLLLNDWQFNAYATMYLYGNVLQAAWKIQQRCLALQQALAKQYTNTREARKQQQHDHDNNNNNNNQNENNADSDAQAQAALDFLINQSISHRVLVSVSRVPTSAPDGDVFVVRLAAMSNEDLYRIFHYCLQPFNDNNWNFDFYRNRIHAVQSAKVDLVVKPKAIQQQQQSPPPPEKVQSVPSTKCW